MRALVLLLLMGVFGSSWANEDALRQEVSELKQRLDAVASQVENNDASSKASKLSFGGYGEHHLNINKGGDNQVDAHRFVMFSGYQFNDKVSLQTELEVEHGLAGDGKPGEVEVEQAYINVKATPDTDVKIGQFLIPVGTINEKHEPDTFYGVERPAYTKRIIPTTWWEAGVMVAGKLGENAKYHAGVHSGLNVQDTGTDLKAIRSGRQKNAKAKANSAAFTTGVSYTPVAGVKVGANVNYQTDITQGAQDVQALFSEVHAVVQKGNMGLKAEYGRWDVDTKDAAYKEQSGYYIEPSYKVTPKVGVFARYSDLEYAGGTASPKEETYKTVGANYSLHKNVVLKADYQKVNKKGSDDASSVNLGVGWSY
ncbi:MAG: porin [Pseudomonadota bacterium]